MGNATREEGYDRDVMGALFFQMVDSCEGGVYIAIRAGQSQLSLAERVKYTPTAISCHPGCTPTKHL